MYFIFLFWESRLFICLIRQVSGKQIIAFKLKKLTEFPSSVDERWRARVASRVLLLLSSNIANIFCLYLLMSLQKKTNTAAWSLGLFKWQFFQEFGHFCFNSSKLNIYQECWVRTWLFWYYFMLCNHNINSSDLNTNFLNNIYIYWSFKY